MSSAGTSGDARKASLAQITESTSKSSREALTSSRSASKAASIPPYATLSFGALSGLASCVLLQPFDLLKTRLQQLDHHSSSASTSSAAAAQKYASRTQKLIAITKDIVNRQGYQGLWRGTTPTVLRNVPGVALYFYSVSHLRAVASANQIPYISVAIPDNNPGANSSTLAKLSTTGNLLTGAVARVTVGFILSPVTVVKARFESSNFSTLTERTLLSSMREIHSASGFRGFFQGFTATALRDAPYAGLYLALYEGCKSKLAGSLGTGNWMVVSGSGLVAGTLATVITHPFDIIKTRMQTTPTEVLHEIARNSGGAVGREASRPSVWGMTKHLWSTSGPRALLDGLGLRCARKAASSAIGWSIFEGGRSWYTEREMRLGNQMQAKRATDEKQV
ncbi:Mitochondrial glycine transporter [Pseudozyma hubeiensis]|nr:Mitochondrial glycine transporter [Pseudozyma hubeiensis]